MISAWERLPGSSRRLGTTAALMALASATTLGTSCFADWTVPAGDAGIGPCTCSPAVPATWNGPVTLLVGTSAESPSCGAYGSQALEGGDDLGATGEATCECSCELGQPSCPEAVVDAWSFTSNACNPTACQGSDQLLPANTCTMFQTTAACGMLWALHAIDTAGEAQCSANPSVSIPEAKWSQPVVACTPGDDPGACDQGRCMPAPPPGGATCVHAPGDTECPEGAYSERRLVYTSVDDTRQCTECSCGSATGISCIGSVNVYPDDTCSEGPQILSAPSAVCQNVQLESLTIYMTYQATPSGGTCTPSGGALEGAAIAEGPTTFCCLP